MIGIDIVETQRMLNKDKKFIERILSKDELDIFYNIKNEEYKTQYLSSRFAAKEALFKAYQQGDKDINYNMISILKKENGAPYIKINGVIMEDLKISISHEKNYSIAIVMKT